MCMSYWFTTPVSCQYDNIYHSLETWPQQPIVHTCCSAPNPWPYINVHRIVLSAAFTHQLSRDSLYDNQVCCLRSGLVAQRPSV